MGESVVTREKSPSKIGKRNTFGESLKKDVLELAREFMGFSPLLKSTQLAQLTQGETALLVIEAAMSRSKSIATTRAIVKHARGLLNYYLELRADAKVSLTGEHSVILLRDYLESLAERGRTVPATAKHALCVWAEALGIDWPMSHNLISAAVTIESNEDAKQAPAMEVSTVRKLEELACNKEVSAYKRAFAASILVMTYASLRFADVQHIRTFETNGDSTHGTMASSKTVNV